MIQAQAVYGSAQVGARLFLAAVGPKDLRQRLPRQRPALAGQIDQQRLGAARVEVQPLRFVIVRSADTFTNQIDSPPSASIRNCSATRT